MEKQWYWSKPVRWTLIILEHVLFVAAAVCFLWETSHPSLMREAMYGGAAKEYEDTNSFRDWLMYLNSDVMNGIRVQNLFESDGVYCPDKIIDIQEYNQSSLQDMRFQNENVHGLAYRLGVRPGGLGRGLEF